MFEYLKDYQHILVSGMQRSGTTICGRMIQWELELPYFMWGGERKDHVDWFISQIDITNVPHVYHLPGLSHLLSEYGQKDNLAIIWMKRDLEEIIKSARRWDPTSSLNAYGLKPSGEREKDIIALSKVKEEKWEEQKKTIKHWYEIKYTSLQEHPLWLGKEERRLKNNRQIKPGGTMEGDLKSLLKDFPKPKTKKEEPDWTPPWEK